MAESVSEGPAGYLSLTLHAHLPYVVNHGTWPHGMEWLHEAAAETYLPLLRVLRRLERDGIGLHCNLNLSPVLLEQLVHPVFQAEFPKYLARKIVAAREDESFFQQSGELHYVETARFWQSFFAEALRDFEALGGGIVGEFRRFHELGSIEVMTCAATHGYLPLLGTDESVRAQVRVAVATHERHFGAKPRGIWMPECGYRPAGWWDYPVRNQDQSALGDGFERIGVEEALAESGLEYTFVDTHLVEGGVARSPYLPQAAVPEHGTDGVYRAWFIAGSYGEGLSAVTAFARDPRTGVQVWSGDTGYPGDAHYLDFHKKRWPGGHRYWRVSGAGVDMNDKQPYYLADARGRVEAHAEHFVGLVREALAGAMGEGQVPVLCAPFDAELFGHWWFEGPEWLEAVARKMHASAELGMIDGARYLELEPRAGTLALPEGSWGAEGTSQVWLNGETSWTYAHLYVAELALREICTAGRWRENETGGAIVRQMCREVLLLESSDWQFLITTGAARDYAELRFLTHHDQFVELRQVWEAWERDGCLNEHQVARLAAIEERDGIFPEVDPGFWAMGSQARA